MYEALTNEKQVSAYTQSPAKIDAREGGAYTFFGGGVSGIYKKLTPTELVFTWRFKEWRDEDESLVTIKLEAIDSSTTKVHLTHTNIVETDRYDNHGYGIRLEQGWEQRFWDGIKRILGYPRADQ